MPSHPIDERADKYIRKEWRRESPDAQHAFRCGATFGYDAALADRAKVDAAKDECVEYLRARAITLISTGTCDHKAIELLDALDAAKKEAGQCQ